MSTLVPVGPEAAGRLAALHASAFDRPWSAAEFEALLDSPGVAAMVADDRGILAGLILIRAVAGEAEILTLCVAPDSRRGGLGLALVEAGAGASAGIGAEALWLEVAADNAAALKLYERAGFEVAGRRPAYYSRGPGLPGMDAVVMRRKLNSDAA